jgi:glycine C-acetyltransferase
MLDNSVHLRRRLTERGLRCHGEPCAIVSVHIGDEVLARFAARALPRHGVITNTVEFPGVARGAARFRLQVMAALTHAQLDAAAAGIAEALAEAGELHARFLARDAPAA